MIFAIRGNEGIDMDVFQRFSFERILLNFINCEIENYIDSETIRETSAMDSEEEYLYKTISNLIIKFLNNHSIDELRSFQKALIKFMKEKSSGQVPQDLGWTELQDTKYKTYSYEGKYHEWFELNDILSCCMLIIGRMDTQNITIKECSNCSTFFTPLSRIDEIYCFECRDIGYEQKVQNDPILKAYRTAYKTKNAYKRRNAYNSLGIEDRWEAWKRTAKDKLKEATNKKISLEEFTEWLKKDL